MLLPTQITNAEANVNNMLGIQPPPTVPIVNPQQVSPPTQQAPQQPITQPAAVDPVRALLDANPAPAVQQPVPQQPVPQQPVPQQPVPQQPVPQQPVPQQPVQQQPVQQQPVQQQPVQQQPVQQQQPIPQQPVQQQQSVADQAAIIAHLRQQNQMLLQQQQAPVQQPPPPPQQPASVEMKYNGSVPLTTDERTALGDLEGPVVKVVTSIVQSMVQPYINQMIQMARDQEQVVVATAQTSYEGTVRAAIPDADQILQDQNFTLYAKTNTVPHSGGQTIFNMLDQAHNNKNSGTVISILREYKGYMETQQQQYRQAQQAQQQQLQAQVVPQGVTPSANTPGPQVPFDLNVYYKAASDLSKGIITAEEYDRIEKVYNYAIQTGNMSVGTV